MATDFIRIKLILFIGLLLVSCSQQKRDGLDQKTNSIAKSSLVTSEVGVKKNILICAHRGDWRNAPENSIQAIKLASQMGVDMVEIDVRTTKDDVLVLMHDETIDRTTSGKGRVSELDYSALQDLQLKNAIGTWTKNKIPKLEEALRFSKDKIDLNIDLKDQSQLQRVLKMVEELGMLDQVLFKQNGVVTTAKSTFGSYLNRIRFMPIVDLSDENALKTVKEYLESNIKLEAFEILVEAESSDFFKMKDLIKSKGQKIWINSLWDNMCANHSDDRAIDDIGVYQWYIDHGIDMIQTDRPQLLMDFLKAHK
jgi:glycerophosphoryl diester phosphodiesterase